MRLFRRPAVSVIVPVFNTEQYVEKCLRSVMAQTFSDIEILVVDDRSPDDSVKIIEKLIADDSRIRLLRHSENLGLGGARNTGIREARGRWIAFIDSDDYITPDMIAALVQGSDGGQFDVVTCGFDRVDGTGRVLSEHLREQKKIDLADRRQNLFEITNPGVCNKLFRRSLFEDNDIYFPEHLYFEDLATTPRLFAKANKITLIGGDYYKYQIHLKSITNQISFKHLIDHFRVFDVLKAFFVKEGIYEYQKGYLNKRIFYSIRFNAQNIKKNLDVDNEEVAQYLRYMLYLRQSYSMVDDAVRFLSAEEVFQALLSPPEDLDLDGFKACKVPT